MPLALHLLDAASAAACPTTLQLLRDVIRTRASDHSALLLGGAHIEDAAGAVGLKNHRVLGVPRGSVMLGLPALRRHLRHLDDTDTLVCWSVATLRAACLLRPRVTKKLVLIAPPTPDACRRLPKLLRAAGGTPIDIIAARPAWRDAVVAAGFRATRTVVARPAATNTVGDIERDALRRRWRIDDTSIPVIALLADPPVTGNARLAGMVAALVHEVLKARRLPAELRLLVHPTQPGRPQAQQLFGHFDVEYMVVQEAELATPWRVLPGCEAALAVGPQNAGLALQHAAHAGVPIIAERHGIATDLFDGDAAWLANPGDQRTLANGVLDVITSPEAAARRAERARSRLPFPHDFLDALAPLELAAASAT